MKRTTKIAIAIAAVFALCLGLVGCGGGDGADYTKNFTGDWKLSGMTENGEAMSGDDIAFMESFGMTVTSRSMKTAPVRSSCSTRLWTFLGSRRARLSSM